MNQKLPESVWRGIRQEYRTSKTTCRELALKYGINRETVSSRCKLEKWRYGRQGAETQRRESCSQLGSRQESLHTATQFNQRILTEAAQWLDRIQEAYETEVKYDRIEAIQKLLPQWKTVVEQAKKGVETVQHPAPAPSLKLDLAVLCASYPLPPRIVTQPQLTA
jgi:hypothetical protein